VPGGRPTKYRPEYCDLVIEVCSEGYSLTGFAGKIGVSRATISEWMGEHPEFSKAATAAQAACAMWWEEHGREIGTVPDAGKGGRAGMVQFALRNMAKEDWKERQELDHQSSDGSMTPTRVEIVAPTTGSAQSEEEQDA